MPILRLSSCLLGLMALIAIFDCANASFGNYFSTGPVSSGNFIRQANTTLVLPNAPNPVKANFGFWPGMGMSNGDLIQSIATSYPGDDVGADCGVVGSDWCVVATVLKSGADYQTDGKAATAKPGDSITFAYHYNDETTAYHQHVYINGEFVSTLASSKGGKALGWGTAEECDSTTPCGTIPEQKWLDTVIILDKADTGYGATAGLTGATGAITTDDGGTTWKVPEIVIEQYTFS